MSLSDALSGRRAAGGSSTTVSSIDTGYVPGEIAARLDRLPPSAVQWSYCLLTQFAWALASSGTAYASKIYPYVWSSNFSHGAYSWLNAIQVGAGLTVGAYLGGYFADRYGRKLILVSGSLLCGLGTIGGGIVSPSFTALLVVAFFGAIGAGFVFANATLYMHEIVPPAYRGRMTMGAQASTAIWSVLGLTLGAFVVPDNYRIYLFVIGGASIVGALAMSTIPESPRWLEGKGRMTQAIATLERIESAVQHRVGDLPEPKIDKSIQSKVKVTERVPLREVFSGEVGRRTLILAVSWFLGYSGIVYGFFAYESILLKHYGFGASQFFIIAMLMYGPGYAGGTLLFARYNERFERRTLVLIGSIIFAAAFAMIYFFSYVHQVNAMLYIGWMLVGTGSALWLFNMYNYTATAFPTRVRSSATGIIFGIGHTGAIVGPLLVVALGDATAEHGFYGYILYCAVIGALVPGLLIRILGKKQSGENLENISS